MATARACSLQERLRRHWEHTQQASSSQELKAEKDQAVEGPDDGSSCDDDGDDDVRVVWDSGTHTKSQGDCVPQMHDNIAAIKDEGNRLLKEGKVQAAIQAYTRALEVVQNESTKPDQKAEAVVFNNRAAAYLENKQYKQALSDAECASNLWRMWSKPRYRMAQALLGLKEFVEAMTVARQGEQLSKHDGCSKDFTLLMDKIAYVASLHGNLAGYDGRLLQVRSAGEEAWLGKEAPYDPQLDGDLPEDITFPGVVKEVNKISNDSNMSLVKSRRVSFRSLTEAVEAAEDGDRIILLRGVHNGCAHTVILTKRVMISGEGELEEATIDFRGNTPAFRIERCAYLKNIFIDMSGFFAAISITGPHNTQPVFDHCKIECSGSDAVHISGSAGPILRDCEISGRKKCAIRVWNSATPQLINCNLHKCGQQGIKAFHRARPFVHHTFIRDCGAEGVAAMGNSHISLEGCVIERNKGPGVDISGAAKLVISSSIFQGNTGGIWGWNNASATCVNAAISGGNSIALLMDEDATVNCKDCVIDGNIIATDLAWNGLDPTRNTMKNTDVSADLPPPVEPFIYVPNPYSNRM